MFVSFMEGVPYGTCHKLLADIPGRLSPLGVGSWRTIRTYPQYLGTFSSLSSASHTHKATFTLMGD